MESGRPWNSALSTRNYASKGILGNHSLNIANKSNVAPKPVPQDPQTSYTIGSTSTASLTEEERRSDFYDSLVRAQRRYAEKISTPTGSGYRFTKAEWESLGENLRIEDWDAGFVRKDVGYELVPSRHLRIKKENMSAAWKGKEKAVEMDIDKENTGSVIC